MRPNALPARLEQTPGCSGDLGPQRILDRAAHIENVLPLEFAVRVVDYIAFGLNTVVKDDRTGCFGSQDFFDLSFAPDVKSTLALNLRIRRIDHAVGVFGRIESALGSGEVA